MHASLQYPCVLNNSACNDNDTENKNGLFTIEFLYVYITADQSGLPGIWVQRDPSELPTWVWLWSSGFQSLGFNVELD